MSSQLWKVICEPSGFDKKVTAEMAMFLADFKNDNGEITLNKDDLEEALYGFEITPELQPLIDFLRKDLEDGEYHNYQIA